jgi:hypothetical protein
MKHLKGVGITFILALLLTCAGQAGATQYTFSFSGTAIRGSGTLDAQDNGNWTSTVTGGYSTVDGLGTFTLVTNPNAPDITYSTGGAFRYDDLLYSSQPFLDNFGLLFFNDTSDMQLNLWGNGAGSPYSAWTYINGATWYNAQNDDVVFNVNPVPEPSTLFLVAAGLAGIGFLRSRTKEKIRDRSIYGTAWVAMRESRHRRELI